MTTVEKLVTVQKDWVYKEGSGKGHFVFFFAYTLTGWSI